MPDIGHHGRGLEGLSIGVDLGTQGASAAFAQPGGSAELLSSRKGEVQLVPLLTSLREDAEVHLRDFVTSCVLTFPPLFTLAQEEALVPAARSAGFIEVRTMPSAAAVAVAFGRAGRFLVLNLGAEAELSVVEGEGREWRVLETTQTAAAGWGALSAALARWMGARVLAGEERTLLPEAEGAMKALCRRETFRWTPSAALGWKGPDVVLRREDLERLCRFPLRSLAHTARRLWREYRPSRLLLTGGASRLPLLSGFLGQEAAPPELMDKDAAVLGAALCAARGARGREQGLDERLRAVRLALVELETALSPEQQNRLHELFQRVEGVLDPEVTELLEAMVRDLRRAAAG